MSLLGIGCIGLGRMGSIFTRHLSGRVPGAKLVAVADSAPGLAERTAAELGVPRWFEDYRELLAVPDVDAVVIATPASTHADVIAATAAAGRPLFSHKPPGPPPPATTRLAGQYPAWNRRIKPIGQGTPAPSTARSASCAGSTPDTPERSASSTRGASATRSPSRRS